MNLLMHKAVSLSRELDLKSYRGKNIYHNAKLLLKLYNKVLWRIEHSLKEMNRIESVWQRLSKAFWT